MPAYSLVYDEARVNSFGGVAIYVHDSFSLRKLDSETLKQNFAVYEIYFLELYSVNFNKFTIGSVYKNNNSTFR